MDVSPLCKCINCGAIIIDENPQTGAKKFPVLETYLEMEFGSDDEGSYRGCPNCHTDSYLIDIITISDLKL